MLVKEGMDFILGMDFLIVLLTLNSVEVNIFFQYLTLWFSMV
jgi:hypothetical protein